MKLKEMLSNPKLWIKGVLLLDTAAVDITGETNSEQNGEPLSAKKRKLGSWLAKSRPAAMQEDDLNTPDSPKQKVDKEISSYEKAIRADATSDPLQWWKVNQCQFPILSTISKHYLCICASSSASERVFSCSGHIVSKRRTCLKPEKVNMLVFLSRNL